MAREHQKRCLSCNKFVSSFDVSEFCSLSCEQKGATSGYIITCKECSKKFAVPRARRNAKFCSHKCRGKHCMTIRMHKRKAEFDAIPQEEKNRLLRKRIMNCVVIDKESGCFLWMRGKDKDGYGCFSYKNYPARAHRKMYEACNGDIPNGMLVCHTCDNASCCNPEHLYLGTPSRNSSDMVARKRNLKTCGENCHTSKLTEDDVREIRKLLEIGVTQAKLARDYKVSKSSLHSIKQGKSWKHVK